MEPDNLLIVFGANDPERHLAVQYARLTGVPYIFALDTYGSEVTAATAYRAPVPREAREALQAGRRVIFFECCDQLPEGALRIDHHRPGDPGYGRPPEEFLPASSLGQLICAVALHIAAEPDEAQRLGLEITLEYVPEMGAWTQRMISRSMDDATDRFPIPQRMVVAAAADHCLGAAYRGECPGVTPEEVRAFRIATRAAFQGRSKDEIARLIDQAHLALTSAPTIEIGGGEVRHLPESVPELVDAAAHGGFAYLTQVGRHRQGQKVVLGGAATPEMVRGFLEEWGPSHGLIGLYGDPARGFAGGYMPD